MDWITDRPPTEADAGAHGDVWVRRQPSGEFAALIHWTHVKCGTPWRRTVHLVPPDATTTEPAPVASQPRRIVSISRTVYGATHTIDAVADDGTAWWKVPGEAEWTQLPALPDRG